MSHLDPEEIRSGEIADAFGKMFWAFLLIFLDSHLALRLDSDLAFQWISINMPPDIIGWFVFLGALACIEDLHPRTAGLLKIARLQCFLNVFTFISFQGAGQTGLDTAGPFAFVSSLLLLFFIWRLCGLIAEVATAGGRPDLAASAILRREVYLAIAIAGWALPPAERILRSFFPPLGFNAFIAITLISLIAWVLIVGLMRKTAIACRQGMIATRLT